MILKSLGDEKFRDMEGIYTFSPSVSLRSAFLSSLPIREAHYCLDKPLLPSQTLIKFARTRIATNISHDVKLCYVIL